MRNYFSKLGTQVPWRTSQSRGATLALPLRYLSALFLLLTFSIGQSWAADPTYDNPSRSTYAEKTFLNVAGTQANVTGTDNYLCYGTLYMANTVTGSKFFTRLSGTGGTSSSSYTYATPATGFLAANSTSATNTYGSINANSDRPWGVYFTGATQVSVLKKDNNTSSNKWVTLKLYTVAADGTETLVETKEESSPDKTNIKVLSCATTLSSSTYYKLEITSGNTSNCPIYQVSFKQPDACSTEITTQPSGATLAVDDANPELSIVATNVASYAWKESSDGTSYDGASSLGSSASFTPSVNDAVQTKYYYCEVTSDCDGTTVVKSNIVTVNVVGAISYYTVTLNPAGGTIVDATGWTSKDGNYEKEVAEGTELTLPIFTKTGRTFKTWRKAGPVDVASPVTVDGDLSLTAIWTATIEQVIYSWEGAEGGAIETGGTAAGNVDNLINQPSAGYYCLKIDGNNSYSANLVTITLAGEEKVKTGDKIKYWGFYSKSSTANARPKMRDANGSNASIFDDPDNLPNLYSGGDPAERTFTVPASINTNAVQLTRSQTGSNTWISKLQIIREVQVEEGDLLTVTFDANGGSAIAPVVVASGQAVAKPADPTKAHNRFNEWQLSGSAYDFSSAVTSNITLVADWTQLYTVTYAKGSEDATGTAPTQDELAAGEKFTVAANTFAFAGHDFSTWNDGANNFDPGVEYTMGSANVTLTAQWVTAATKYAITKGSHANGDFTISPAEQAEGQKVTLVVTPDEDYVFDAWEIVKTEDASATGILVDDNGQFEMPAYAVTVNATFVADPRQKVLYVTSTAAATAKANDKLYAALKDIYNVKIVGPTSDADQSAYALVVLHESVGGGDYNKTAVAAAKTGSTPVLNTKSYFYNSDRFGWGTPNAGQTVKGATLNSAYCNIADHPLFSGVTITDGFFEITDDAAAKCMQPIGSFTSGKEGYTLATTPNADSGDGAAIHELTPTQRGASAGKYLMISVSNAKLDALNANGQKLFQNAAAYLIGSTSWEPIAVPTSPVIEAAPSAAYSVGDNITLSALAAGVSATTTYTWYKGDSWAAAETAGAIQAAKTAAEGGDSYGITGCALGDAGIYWCVISNGTDCEAKASLEVTVVDASYNISFSSAHGTAPSATTGVSYTLPELTASGWAHQGWTASVNVFVDAEEVVAGTLIANGKMAVFGLDVTFTAVWAQEFQVTFNGNGHGTPIAAQTVVNGELATEPDAPFEIGQIFDGWFTDNGTFEAPFDFATPITANTPLYAKWTEFAGCVELWPATSGTAPEAVGDAINMQTGSKGATMTALDKVSNLTYTTNGLQFGSTSGVKVNVVLNNDMTVGTKITMTLVAGGTGTRGLLLYTKTGAKINDFTCWVDGTNPASNGAEDTFTYTVVADDGLDGTNEFQLWRNNTVILKSLKVESCGSAVVFHNLTSAVSPAGMGTITLGASSVREGYTTTAEYSAIDAAYEFDEWQISGTDATIDDAHANPVTITMGTVDAVVTLKLKVATVKYTVTFDAQGGSTVDPQQVADGASPVVPTAPTKEDYIFRGWADSDGASVSDVVDVTSFTINAPKTFYAVWEAEPAGIKLFNDLGELNTTNFVSAAATTIEIDAVEYPTLVAFASNRTSLGGAKKADLVQYNATTDQTMVRVDLYNTNSNAKTAYLWVVEEGDAAATQLVEISVPGTTRVKTGFYTFNSTKNRSVYLTSAAKADIKVLQVKVVESGTAVKQAGQVGYSVNLNKGRMCAPVDTPIAFEGLTLNVSSEYAVLNNSNLATKSSISFSIASPLILHVEKSGGKFYVSQDPADKGTIYNANSDIELNTTGTWYVGSETSGSAASFTLIRFDAPKCEKPTIATIDDEDLCEGDAFTALVASASVSDDGTLHYAWFKEAGATDEAVGTDAASFTPDADGEYYVIVTNQKDGFADNTETSNVVTVQHLAGTTITTAPVSVRKDAGEAATLTVVAAGKNLAYEWFTCNADGTGAVAVDPAATEASLDVIVPDGEQYYKVVVTGDCGTVEAIAKVEKWVELTQQDVTETTLWDFSKTGVTEDVTIPVTEENPVKLLANIPTVNNNELFRSDNIVAGDGKLTTGYIQTQKLSFHATVPGYITVTFSNTGNKSEYRYLVVNGVQTAVGSKDKTAISYSCAVQKGDVELTVTEGNGGKMFNFRSLKFEKMDYFREIRPGYYGTICLEHGGKMYGAALYEVAYFDGADKIFFDEIIDGTMEPGMPYIFQSEGGSTALAVAYSEEAPSADALSKNGLYGSFSQQLLAKDAGNYILLNNQYLFVNSDNVYVGENRAYIRLNDISTKATPLAPGRRRIAMGVQNSQVATGMENLNAGEAPMKVMIDGQLFILRGENMFDATGRLVK